MELTNHRAYRLFTIEQQKGKPAFTAHTHSAWFEAGNLGTHVFSSTITSMTLSASRVLTTTTRGDSRHSELRFMNLLDPASPEAGSTPQVDFEVVFQAHRNHRDSESFWSSAPLPGSDLDTTIAVGTDSSVRLYSSSNGAMWTHPQTVRIQEGASVDAALSLAWINRSTLAIGQRTGKITLWDTRTAHGASSKAMRLQHPLSVNHLKIADAGANQLVAAGPLWSTCMYDLRMPHDATGRGWEDVASKPTSPLGSLQTRIGSWSTPVVRYMAHDGGMRETGCDIHIENGLLALGTRQRSVALYSLQNGNLLRDFANDNTHFTRGSYGSQCRFVETDGEDVLLYTREQSLHAAHWR